MPAPISRKFVGKGKIWLAITGGKLIDIGNVDKADLSAKVDSDKVLDYTKGGGGVAARYSAISEASISLSMTDLSASNLAMALLGSATAVNSGTVTAEAVIANKGGLVPLARVGATAVVVKNSALTITYALNTDYTVSGAGLTILNGGAIIDLQALSVAYAYPSQTDIQTMLTSGQEFRLFLDGLNDGESGKPHVVEIYRWKPDPTSGLSLIGDKFGRLTLQGEMLADTTKTGTGISQYARISQVD